MLRGLLDIKTRPEFDANDFKRIKPREGTTVEQARSFWDKLFSKEIISLAGKGEFHKSERKENRTELDKDLQPKDGRYQKEARNGESEASNDGGKQNEARNEEAEKKKDGLTDEEKDELKERTGWPDEIINSIRSMEEAEIYIKAGLKPVKIGGKWCLIRGDIDLDQVDEDGISNRQRMERGRPPITKDGKEVELHHIGQRQDSPLAELTTEEHRGTGNDTVLHDKTKESEIDRTEFAKERSEHWKSRAEG